MFVSSERLGKDVCRHLLRWEIIVPDRSVADAVTHEIISDVDVLGPWMVRDVVCELESALIVAKECSW